ncbi:hypothetical protein E4U53_007311 [Claviceps sorghi]|nr:hypothetical protein E4U53_007311 [Claviceps sorghi]
MDSDAVTSLFHHHFPNGHTLQNHGFGLVGLWTAVLSTHDSQIVRYDFDDFIWVLQHHGRLPWPVAVLKTIRHLTQNDISLGVILPDRVAIATDPTNRQLSTEDEILWLAASNITDPVAEVSFSSVELTLFSDVTQTEFPSLDMNVLVTSSTASNMETTAAEQVDIPETETLSIHSSHYASATEQVYESKEDADCDDGESLLSNSSDLPKGIEELSSLFHNGTLNKVVILVADRPLPGYHPDYLRRLGHCQAPGIHTSLTMILGPCVPDHLTLSFRSVNGSKVLRVADIHFPLWDAKVSSRTIPCRELDELSQWLPCSTKPPFNLKKGTQDYKYPDIDHIPRQLGKDPEEVSDAEYLSSTCDAATRVDFTFDPTQATVIQQDGKFWDVQLRDHQGIVKDLVSPFFEFLTNTTAERVSPISLSVLMKSPDDWNSDFDLLVDQTMEHSDFFTLVKNGNDLANFDYSSCVVDDLQRPERPVPRLTHFMSMDQYTVTQIFGAADVSFRDKTLAAACRNTLVQCRLIPIAASEWTPAEDDLEVFGIQADGQPTKFLVSIAFDKKLQAIMPDIDERVKMVFNLEHRCHALPNLMGDDTLRRRIAAGLIDQLIAARQRSALNVAEEKQQHDNTRRKERVAQRSAVFDDTGAVEALESGSDEEDEFDEKGRLLESFCREASRYIEPFIKSEISVRDREIHASLTDKAILSYRVLDLARRCFQNQDEGDADYQRRIRALFDDGTFAPSTPEPELFGAPWSGRRVVQPRSSKPKSDFFFLVQRPKQQGWPAPFSAPFISVTTADRFTNPSGWQEFFQLCVETPPLPAFIWRDVDEATSKAEANAVRAMHNLKKSSPRSLWFEWLPFMSPKFPTEAQLNLLTIFPGLQRALTEGVFSDKETSYVQAFQNCKGGVAFVAGVPGAGKTTFIMKVSFAISSDRCLLDGVSAMKPVSPPDGVVSLHSQPVVDSFDVIEDDTSPFANVLRTRVVFAGAQNVQLDDALDKWVATYSQDVMRVYSYDMEMRHVFKPVVTPTILVPGNASSHFQTSCVELVNMTEKNNWERCNPSLSPFSLSSLIKVEARSNPLRWSDILEGIEARQKEPLTFRAKKATYLARARECAKVVLAKTRVIFCTPVVARDIANHHLEWYPGLVIGDEAGRMTEAMSLILTSCWPKAAVVFTGDPLQFGPMSATFKGGFDITASQGRFIYRDIFGPQRTVSLLSRADSKGMTDILLSDSYRAEGDCQLLAVTNFYSGRMNVVFQHSTAQSTKWKDCLYHLIGRRPSVCSMFVDMPDVNEERTATTFVNLSSAKLVVNLARWIALQNMPRCTDLRGSGVESTKVRKATICVMTPYKAQKAYLAELFRAVAPTEIHRQSLDIRLVDESAGFEADFVIYDLVRTSAVGFTDDRLRNNVAVTRARLGQFFIGSSSLFSGLRPENPLRSIYAFHDRMNAIEVVKGYAKVCDYCDLPGHFQAQCPWIKNDELLCNVCNVTDRRRRHFGHQCPNQNHRTIPDLSDLHLDQVRPLDNVPRHPFHIVAGSNTRRDKKRKVPRKQLKTESRATIFQHWMHTRAAEAAMATSNEVPKEPMEETIKATENEWNQTTEHEWNQQHQEATDVVDIGLWGASQEEVQQDMEESQW